VTAIPVGGQPGQYRMTGIDTVIRVSTAGAVLVNAAVAAYISYWHAYAVVRAHGGTGITARLEPATIDGLVYASSMVMLYAARHGHRVPVLARWSLGAGIFATLAANMAQGLSSGPVGAVIAAWPAVSLVGSYELLVWIIRTAAAGGPDRGPVPDHTGWNADHLGPGCLAAGLPESMPDDGPGRAVALARGYGPQVRGPAAVQRSGPEHKTVRDHADQGSGPGHGTLPDHPDHDADQILAGSGQAGTGGDDGETAAAVAAYRASLQKGRPLSERKLAAMFGKTSRRWARNRMAEARQSPVPV
jgi:Protein of unknown function (DUF2637)